MAKIKLGDDGSNILRDKNFVIPDWWGGKEKVPLNGIKTRTDLLAKRKSDNMPDISYDLDGDGYVGGRDYVIAKYHDKDGDGKLNAQER